MAITTEIRLDSFRDLASEMSMGVSPSDSLSVDAAVDAPTSFFDHFVEAVMGPSTAEPAANMDAAPDQNADLGIKQASNWKPETKLNNDVVAKGVVQSNDTANAMGAEAKEGLANIAEIKKDMNEQAAPAAKAQGGNMDTLTGVGKGLLFDTAVVGAVGLVGGPGAAAAMGGVMMARDALKAVSGGGSSDPRMSDAPSPKSVTLTGREARNAKRGDLPEDLRKAQYGPSNSLEKAADSMRNGTGYNRAPVTNAMFKDLAKGAGFGLTPQEKSELGPRSALAHDSLTDDSFEQIKVAEAGFENQLHTAQDLKAGLDARRNNGVEVTNQTDLGDLKAREFQMTASAKAVLIPGAMA